MILLKGLFYIRIAKLHPTRKLEVSLKETTGLDVDRVEFLKNSSIIKFIH